MTRLKFMVLAAPRSASTWAANFFTTDRSLCLHDPVLQHTPEELDAYEAGVEHFGVSCTALPLLTDWVDQHPAKKIILHRPLGAIDESLVKLGLPKLGPGWAERLRSIHGLHLMHEELFDPKSAAAIWHYLEIPSAFSVERHRLLTSMYVEPYHDRVPVTGRARTFAQRVREAVG